MIVKDPPGEMGEVPGAKKKRGAFRRPALRVSNGGLLHLRSAGSRSRGLSAAADRLVCRVLRVVEERRLVIRLVLDPGIIVRKWGGLALELPLMEVPPLGILPEFGQYPLGSACRHVGRRRCLTRLEADHVDEEEAAVEGCQERQEDEKR